MPKLKQKLLAKLKKEFPEVKFKKVELVTRGFDHDVLVLDNKLIFRFAKAKLYKNSFVREMNFIKQFGKISNLRIPNYIYLSKDKTFGGYEKIQGKELTFQIYQKLSSAKRKKLIRELAKFLSLLHNFPLKKANALGFKPYSSWTLDQQKRQKWFKKEYYPKMSKFLEPGQLLFIKNFIDYFTSSKERIKPVLGHFDLSHDHIIMRPNGDISGIIDFGDMSIGDPAYEFNGFSDYNKNLTKQIYAVYKGPKDKRFLQRAYDHYVHRWIYLLYDAKIRRANKDLWKEAVGRINNLMRLKNLSR